MSFITNIDTVDDANRWPYIPELSWVIDAYCSSSDHVDAKFGGDVRAEHHPGAEAGYGEGNL